MRYSSARKTLKALESPLHHICLITPVRPIVKDSMFGSPDRQKFGKNFFVGKIFLSGNVLYFAQKLFFSKKNFRFIPSHMYFEYITCSRRNILTYVILHCLENVRSEIWNICLNIDSTQGF